ncbi:acyltransferase [Ancylobacter sp. MQZ15Z-1]|uniref:Acyltransferase n=1 Tax=Ancylobacter mangrovi TaxID=2972472 RepID=A0A9X2PD01_9HYPH|nr:acyltransferase [Ancylobacter mangrovi]
MRFFAAAGIVFLHIGGRYGVPKVDVPLANGVMLFFVLSGFILTYVYAEVEGADELKRFYLARFARVWPLHLATFLAAVVFAVNASFPSHAVTATVSALNLALLQSWVPTASVAYSFNSVSWSLSNELFFYALFPLLRRNLARSWHWKLLLSLFCGLLVAWSMVVFELPMSGEPTQVTTETLAISSPLSHLFQFVIGMCCCLVWLRIRHLLPTSLVPASLLEIGLVLFGWWLGYHVTEIRGFGLLFGERAELWMNFTNGLVPAVAALIIVLASGNGIVGRFLASRPLVFLGEISYAIYMSHFVILIVLLRDFDGLASWPWWLALVSYLGLTLLVSTLLFLFVEKPLRNFITGRRHATS